MTVAGQRPLRRSDSSSLLRLGMFTIWLITVTVALAVAATAESRAVTVAPASGVKGQPETELTLHCGDGQRAGQWRAGRGRKSQRSTS